jgi:hypothetical protein
VRQAGGHARQILGPVFVRDDVAPAVAGLLQEPGEDAPRRARVGDPGGLGAAVDAREVPLPAPES